MDPYSKVQVILIIYPLKLPRYKHIIISLLAKVIIKVYSLCQTCCTGTKALVGLLHSLSTSLRLYCDAMENGFDGEDGREGSI